MGINVRWIHFVLFLLLVLGRHSGLSGQSSEEPAKTAPYAETKSLLAFIEPASQKKKPTMGGELYSRRQQRLPRSNAGAHPPDSSSYTEIHSSTMSAKGRSMPSRQGSLW